MPRNARMERRRPRGQHIAEFGPVMVIFVLLFFPLLSLFSYLCGVATVMFACNVAAREAGSARDFRTARENMNNLGNNIIGGPFGQFGNVRPLNSSGMQLLARQVRITGTAELEQPASLPVDTRRFTYYYRVNANYTLEPLFWPGGPVPVTFSITSHCEHPRGLANP